MGAVRMEDRMTTTAMPKPRADHGMEGMVAKWYAVNTGEMIAEYVELAQRLAPEIPEGSAVLEVAPGPGYFSIELAKLGSYAITGLDLSQTFVKMAKEKALEAGVDIRFLQGTASKMPFPDQSFDFLLCRAAFKNFGDPLGALREMWRVLKPGGRGLVIDLRGDATREDIDRGVDRMTLSWFNKLMTRLAFKTMLLKRAYTAKQFRELLAQTRFSRVDIVESNFGLEITMTR